MATGESVLILMPSNLILISPFAFPVGGSLRVRAMELGPAARRTAQLRKIGIGRLGFGGWGILGLALAAILVGGPRQVVGVWAAELAGRLASDFAGPFAAEFTEQFAAGFAEVPFPGQQANPAPNPMRGLAVRAAGRPMKLDVEPLENTAHVGDKILVQVNLLDANNQLAKWNHASEIEVVVTGPSGNAKPYAVTVPAKETGAKVTIDATELGLANLQARDKEGTLLPGGNSILIRRVKTANRPKKMSFVRRQSAHFFGWENRGGADWSGANRGTANLGGARLLTVAARLGGERFSYLDGPNTYGWQTPGGAAPGAGAHVAPELLLTNSSGKDEILADGKDFARIQVFYMDPDGGAAPADIKLWLTWSNGTVDTQPLVIKKGDIVAEAHWTSMSPVSAKISLVASAPGFQIANKNELAVSFVPAIYGIGIAGPNPLQLSLIDCEPVFAQFFDHEGRTVQTSRLRDVTFISSNPSLHLDPSKSEVPANGSSASIYLVPTWSGTANLDIWTPGYDHQTVVVKVTMWLVLLLCLAGGIVGGVAAWDALKGAIGWRVFVGILGGIVLVWISVYAVLPKTHSIIAHNLVSVFVVAVVGGFGGTRVLDFAGKKLGFI